MNALNLNQDQITRLVQAILTPAQRGECKCHWLDAEKVRILAWPSQKDPDTLILKVAEQKFIGLVRSDKRSEKYWKFKNVFEGTEVPQDAPQAPGPKPEVKVPEIEDSAKQTNFPSSESEQVLKFKEKYGSADNPK